MTTIGAEVLHGTYERFVGTETTPGCDCKHCKNGYKKRMALKNSLSRFNPRRH